jgi:hypothetical protein
MTDNSQLSAIDRLRRSCVYVLVAVGVSTLALLVVALIGSKTTPRSSGTSVIDVLSYILGFPLLLGWFLAASLFGVPGSCASAEQFFKLVVSVPLTSVVIDTGIVFSVWEFFHRKKMRGLDSDNILHIR